MGHGSTERHLLVAPDRGHNDVCICPPHKKVDYDTLKGALQTWLDGGEEESNEQQRRLLKYPPPPCWKTAKARFTAASPLPKKACPNLKLK